VSITSRLVGLVLIAVPLTLGLTGCGFVSSGTPAASICNGVSTEIRPCDAVPSFEGNTCEALAAEYGTALDRALLEIVRGPADVGGEAKSSRLIHAEASVTTALTDRMVAIGLIETCTMPAFLDAAQVHFSQELETTIGHALYDGQPDVTYEEFLNDLSQIMSGIGKQP